MKISNKQYDTLKWVASIAFPAFIALVTTTGTALNWPHTQITTIILGAVNAFLGALLGSSTKQYNKDDQAEEAMKVPYVDLREDDK